MPANVQKHSVGEELAAAIRQGVPRRPGVYLFQDETGKTIYIGKSINLRQRMLTYFTGYPARIERHVGQMTLGIRAFDYLETDTELLALLLEDALSKRELPPYNIRQLKFEQYRYLVLSDDRYPTCRIVDREEASSGTVFGPFGDVYFATAVLEIVHRHFLLRSCVDPNPFRRSLNFELGLCSGPCWNGTSVSDYGFIVSRVKAFLSGRDDWIAGKLQASISSSSAALNYEKAAKLKTELEFCKAFCARQRFIHRFRIGRLTVRELGDRGASYEFAQGNLVSVRPLDRKSGRRGVGGRELVPDLADPRKMLDRANLIYSWLGRDRDNREHGFV